MRDLVTRKTDRKKEERKGKQGRKEKRKRKKEGREGGRKKEGGSRERRRGKEKKEHLSEILNIPSCLVITKLGEKNQPRKCIVSE